ncbi:T9SS type A sorting domain-containing protein [Chryseobacterium caseinilyticum]|uniref:T9SS type A sorting domain-containing protein n=1 Tax=Chryseobacterium caseinilyticum TaxID=2771428 RepID=A0ABR8ZFC3_9FLAO|nr:T9SS type A sorting domain-containing protein [Chryseobacterium caseinilyticum]MBD8083922.1 T9SS type A sorting domain-containing protein [Chryseobacterium caseinilyticum]
MKKILFSLTLCVSLANAQTTITKAYHDPVSGDISNFVSLNGTPDHSATGANTVFNNSALTMGAASPGTYSTPTAAEISTYPGSTLKYVNSGTTVYYKQTAAKLEITALVTTDATINLSTNNGTFISYPTSFGLNESDTASGTFSAQGFNGNVSGNINISADAWGTLLIGTKTYSNVTRVKSVQNFAMTVFGFPAGTIVNTSYAYYDSAHKAPLFSTTNAVITIGTGAPQNSNVAQALNEVYLAVKDAQLKNKLEFYPNPATDVVHFRNGDNANIMIYNAEGKVLKQINKSTEAVQVSDLPSGVYFITAEKGGVLSETKKLIKK